MKRAFRMTLAVLATAMATTGLFGCDKVADMVGKKAKKEAEKALAEASSPGGASPGATGAAMNLFADASSVGPKFKEKIPGPVRFLELIVYPEYAIADIQNPNKKLEADQYTLRNGAVGDSGPLKFSGKQPTEKDLAATTFPLEEVDFTQVPKMAADALATLGLAGGKTTHMILERRDGGTVRWRVYVTSERSSGGSVEYDTKGVKGKVWK